MTMTTLPLPRSFFQRAVFLGVACASLGGAFSPEAAVASTQHYHAYNGSWFTDYWSAGGIPGSGDTAIIGCDVYSPVNVYIDQTGALCDTLELGYSGTDNQGTLEIRNGGSFSCGGTYVGYDGIGYLTLQAGGSMTLTNQMWLSRVDTASSGQFWMQGGTLTLTSSSADVCRGAGSSTFIMDGGVIVWSGNNSIDAQNFCVGMTAGYSGSFSISGTNRSTCDNLLLAYQGNGTYSQNTNAGFNVTVNSNFRIAEYSGVTGTYNLTGGVLSATAEEYVGVYGNGCIHQDGGVNQTSANVWLGYYGTSNSSYKLHGGTLSFTSSGKKIYVGYGGSGRFEWYAGNGSIVGPVGGKPEMRFPTSTHAGTLAMGWTSGFSIDDLAAGNYGVTMYGLDSSTLEITNHCTATQTGSATVYKLVLGAADGDGTYNLNSGLGVVTTNLVIGAGGATGTLNVQGGTASVANCLLAQDTGSVGYLNLSSGSLTIGAGGSITTGTGAGYLHLDGAALVLNAATKTIRVSGLYVGHSSGAAVAYEFGANYDVAATHQYVGYGRSGTLTLTGNAGDTATSMELAHGVGIAGAVKLRGGTLTVGSIAAGGGTSSLYLDGGALSLTGAKTATVTNLYVGGEAGASLNYTFLSGWMVSAASEYVGYCTSATLTQATGSSHSATAILLGANGNTGTLRLQGGTLTVGGIATGPAGTANLSLDGATVNFTGNKSISVTNLRLAESSMGSSVPLAVGAGDAVVAGNFYVGYGRTATLTQTGGSTAVASAMYLGHEVASSGTYELTGGMLLAGNATVYIGNDGTGASGALVLQGSALAVIDVVNKQTAGKFTSPVVPTNQSVLRVNNLCGIGDSPLFGGNLQLGHNGGSGAATYTVAEGQSLTVDKTLTVGYNAPCSFTQSGDVSVGNLQLADVSSTSTYDLNGGTLTVVGAIGHGAGAAMLNINGGRLQFTSGVTAVAVNDLGIATTLGSNVTLSISGDSTNCVTTNQETIGRLGAGTVVQTGGNHVVAATLALGSGGGTGTYVLSGGAFAGGNLTVRNDSASAGIFRGAGAVGFSSTLCNSGQVVADGGGNDASALDMSSFAKLDNAIDNAVGQRNGWLAENHGKLLLPLLHVLAGDGTYNWGERHYGTSGGKTIDLVNSVQMTFAGANGGSLSGALLAVDRAELPALPSVVIGVWQFDAPGLTFDSLNLTFRYDEAALPPEIDEQSLRVWHYVDGAWLDITTGKPDVTNKWIYADGVKSLSYFAVGVPEPGTLALLAVGALGLLGRLLSSARRRRKPTGSLA
jgi:hypothetical protein